MVTGSGGGSPSWGTGETAWTTGAGLGRGRGAAPKPNRRPSQPSPKPQALSPSALVKAGDAVCSQSQETFTSLTPSFPSGEEEPNAAYSRVLLGISTRAVDEFNKLTPPPSLSNAYEAYVKAQEEVKKLDEKALKAAEKGQATPYLKAREKRDAGVEERHQLAQAVGFEVCSAATG